MFSPDRRVGWKCRAQPAIAAPRPDPDGPQRKNHQKQPHAIVDGYAGQREDKQHKDHRAGQQRPLSLLVARIPARLCGHDTVRTRPNPKPAQRQQPKRHRNGEHHPRIVPRDIAVVPDLSQVEDVKCLPCRATRYVLKESCHRGQPQPGPTDKEHRHARQATTRGIGPPCKRTHCQAQGLQPAGFPHRNHRQTNQAITGGANNSPCNRTSIAAPQTAPASAKCQKRPPARGLGQGQHGGHTEQRCQHVEGRQMGMGEQPRHQRHGRGRNRAGQVALARPVHAPTIRISSAKATAGANRAAGIETAAGSFGAGSNR